MASSCISSCVNDARVPVRATYVNLYKWPESDVEFIRSVSSKKLEKNNNDRHGHVHHPKVVDSISCRQLYLRSYTFSREEENVNETKVKCYGKRKKKLARRSADDVGGSSGGRSRRRRRKCKGFRKVKEISCSALVSIFRRLLSCTTKVDVVG